MFRHEMKEIKLPISEEDLKMLEDGFEDLVKYNHPLPWRWLQPRGLGADLYIFGGKEDPYVPVCHSRLSFPQNDFIVNLINNLPEILALARKGLHEDT